MFFLNFQSASSSNNGAGGINLGPVVGGRRPPSQQSFHSSKNNHSHHSRHQTTSVPPSTPRNACQLPEIGTRCIRKYNIYISLRLGPSPARNRNAISFGRSASTTIGFVRFVICLLRPPLLPI